MIIYLIYYVIIYTSSFVKIGFNTFSNIGTFVLLESFVSYYLLKVTKTKNQNSCVYYFNINRTRSGFY